MKLQTVDVIRNTIYQGASFVDDLLKRESNIVVLCYHSISNDGWRYSVSPDSFRDQLNLLTKWGSPITLKQLTDYLNGNTDITTKSFLITFDDGYQDVLNAEPILNKLNIRPTLFVLSNPDKAKVSILATKRSLLTNLQIRQLAKTWDIGCHSSTHPVLADCSKQQLISEIVNSKKQLESIIGKSIKAFCYPKGIYSTDIISYVKQAGYSVAFSMDDKLLNKDINRFAIPRVGVDGSHTIKEFSVLSSPSVTTVRGLMKRFVGGIYV